MKITKKSFINELVTNKSYFIGITKRLYAKDELFCQLSDLLTDNNIILEQRTAKARSNGLQFNNNSILDFNQYGNYTFYKYEYTTSKYILICLHTYYDDFDNTEYQKAMYYFINK